MSTTCSKIINFSTHGKRFAKASRLDMDFEKQDSVNLDEYINMIALKTSVLLAASLQMGAILGGAGNGNQQHYMNSEKTSVLLSRCRMITWMHLAIPKIWKQVGGGYHGQ